MIIVLHFYLRKFRGDLMGDRPWLKLYPNEIPATLTYEETTIHSYLTKVSRNYPRKNAIHFMGKNITYKELYDYVQRVAKYMYDLGIKKGDRVAIMLPNCPQSVICFYAVLQIGAVVVQTNPLYTERELEYQLKDSGAKAIISLDILYPRISKVYKRTSLKHVIVTAIKDFLPFPINLIYPYIQKKQTGIKIQLKEDDYLHLLSNILAHTEPSFNEEVEIDLDNDLALLQYTGGTTGQPKGVMLTHKNLIANSTACAAWLFKAIPGEERVLGILPLFHVYGLTTVLILSIMQGNEMILIPRLDVKMLLKTIHKKKPTLFPGAPTIYIALLNHPDLKKYNLSSIKACISGAAPLPVEVQEKFEEVTGGKLVEGYGLTESSPVTHANFIWGQKRVKGSIGVPWPDTDAKIVDPETGEDLPPGEIGEIVVKGPQVMKGYWNREEETAETLKDGWLYTGDLGYMDEEGFFYVVDRKKDVIIAGGYNIYPREIEEIFYEHPAIQELTVVGVPDPYRGETVKAYIVLKPGANVTEEELDEYARKHLAAYKVPRIYEFRKELPKSTIGKVLRRTLLEEEINKPTNQ